MPTRDILPGEGPVGYIKPLIPFSCLYDTDVGLIKLIQQEYRSPEMFSLDFIDSFRNDIDLISFMYQIRVTENPILPFMKNKGDAETADSLYQQFMDQRYEDIVKLSPKTGIYNVCKYIYLMEEITASIYYKNDFEYYVLKNNSELKNISYLNKKEIENNNSFEQYYLKSLTDSFADFVANKAESNTIYILNYKFNLGKDNDLIENRTIGVLELRRNHIVLMDAYNKNVLKGNNSNE